MISTFLSSSPTMAPSLARRLRGFRACWPVLDTRPAPIAVAMGVLLLILSAVDAAATLVLLSAGAEEINPAMRLLLGQGVGTFLAGKFALTAVGSVVLVLFAGRRLFRSPVRAGHVLAILVGLYAVLNTYQAALLLAI
jgi:hypothetical protein